ncbi:MAG TPA: ABC transporter ATP-binding protein [Nitrospiraceae bacterium]|nr:ABC transporter ATP-binding protein [Nitrospiraceae bacterium]
MDEPSVDIRDLVKYHGATPAVDHCSLTVRKGEFFSLLGPSGSGKTSTLRLVAGFEQPDHGEIVIEGRSMNGVPPNRRPVNLVFQNYALFPHLTVFGNIAFGLEMRGVSKVEIASRVQAALEMVKLADRRDRLPAELSGGEQQRVALVRALVNRPAVVLLDEPLGALDQQLRLDMQVELKAIQVDVGLTFLYVTHHQEEALTMSDRVAVMHRGRILQVGSPQEIYESPASLFVAQFIGLSNSVPGRVIEVHGTQCTLRAPDLPDLHAPRSANVREGSRATLVLRPERLHLAQERRLNGFENAIPARIEKAVYNGSEMQYWARLPDQEQWKVRVPNGGVDQKRFQAGDAVCLQWSVMDGVTLAE